MATVRPIRDSLAPYESYPVQNVLSRAAQRHAGKTAVIDGERTFTYRDLDRHSSRFAAALATQGTVKGDRIAVLAPNCVEFIIAFYGILRAGAVPTTVNPAYREREVAHQLNDSGAVTLIVHEAVVELAEAVRDMVPGLKRTIVIESGSSGTPGFNDAASFWGLIESASDSTPDIRIDPREDLAALPYSSGTTGLSKGVMLTHHNLTSNLRQIVTRGTEAASMRADDIVLVHLPLFHIYGLHVLMNGSIGVGATQVMMGRFDIELFLKLMADHKVSVLFTVPPVGLGLTQYPGVANYDLSALRLGFFGAAPLSEEMQMRIQQTMGFPIMQGYGLTETSPVTNMDFIEPELARPGSVGPATSDTEEKVVDLESGTREVPFGETGELMVRGPQVMKGYFDNAQATAETLTEDGWLRTGDIVRQDADGYMWIVDRKKELIKYKGFQVPPAELEGILLEHPGIADAAVIGKQDLESGEVPRAFVVRAPGAEMSDEDVMGFVADKVATFKYVREVEFVDAIPKNPSGKILRRVLIEQKQARDQG